LLEGEAQAHEGRRDAEREQRESANTEDARAACAEPSMVASFLKARDDPGRSVAWISPLSKRANSAENAENQARWRQPLEFHRAPDRTMSPPGYTCARPSDSDTNQLRKGAR
jgi:hypothetical protein